MTINSTIFRTGVLFSFLFLFSLKSSAQKTVYGTITDASSGNPIPHVEVFISGTTVGCISDSAGNYSLTPPILPCVLIADHVSYKPVAQKLEGAQKLNLKLDPENINIDEVSVSAKNKRKKNLRFFYSHFITENQNKIKILNDSVLIFHSDKMKFAAKTSEPLIIINNYLGYKIKVIMEEFSVIALDSPNGKRLPLNSLSGGEVTELTGYYYYEPLEHYSKEKAEEYELNRRKSYYGSYRHFLKSIYDNDPEMQGYEMEVFAPEPEAGFYEIPSVNSPGKEYVIYADSLKVYYWYDQKGFPVSREERSSRNFYSQEVSTIYNTNESFLIRKNGTSPRLPFIIDGLMTIKSFANSLPEDYVPPTE